MSSELLSANIKEKLFSADYSNLKSDTVSGLNTVDVYSIGGFAINQIISIGNPATEGSEIIKTSASTAPSGSTITLASNLIKSHSKDTLVYIIPYDQIEFSRADTLTGTNSVLGSVTDLDPEKDIMTYNDTVNTTGYYFWRFKNSITSVFSDYSDGIPYSGFPDNTFGYALQTAMNELHVKFSAMFDEAMAIRFGKQMLRLVRGKMTEWSKYQKYGEVVDQLAQLTASYAAPTTLYDKNTNKSILNVYVDGSPPLIGIDRSEFLIKTVEAEAVEAIDTPEYYSIWDGNIYLWPRGNDDTEGKDLLMDYNSDIETIDSLMDVIEGTKFDMMIPYLKYKIRGVLENNGKEDLKDPSYQEFRELLNDSKWNDGSGEIKAFRPRKRAIEGGRVGNYRR